jgi:hypothetical protein
MNAKFLTTCKAIAKKTNWNDHTGALIAGARLLNCDNLVIEFQKIAEIQKKAGYLPAPAKDARYILYTEMMETAEKQLPKEMYNIFHGSF